MRFQKEKKCQDLKFISTTNISATDRARDYIQGSIFTHVYMFICQNIKHSI